MVRLYAGEIQGFTSPKKVDARREKIKQDLNCRLASTPMYPFLEAQPKGIPNAIQSSVRQICAVNSTSKQVENMRLYFYRGEAPNFGDELNTLLMPRIFGDILDERDDQILLAIGSVLFDSHSPSALKVVFGSGYGGYTKPPRMDDSWRVYCLRGPRSAKILGLSDRLVAGDPAILIRQHYEYPGPKQYAASFMPHWVSAGVGHWKEVCRLAGIHYIDPRSDVSAVLDEISASRLLLTEAMHGAIVADALRTPWIPMVPLMSVNRMKWDDWADALSMSLRWRRLLPSYSKEWNVLQWLSKKIMASIEAVGKIWTSSRRTIDIRCCRIFVAYSQG